MKMGIRDGSFSHFFGTWERKMGIRDGSFSHFFKEKVGKGTVPDSHFPTFRSKKWEKEPSLIPISPLSPVLSW